MKEAGVKVVVDFDVCEARGEYVVAAAAIKIEA